MIRRKNVNAEQAAYKALEKNGLRVKPAITGKAEDYSFVVFGDHFSVVSNSSLVSKDLIPKAFKKYTEMERVIVCAEPGKQYALTGTRRGKRFSNAVKDSIVKP